MELLNLSSFVGKAQKRFPGLALESDLQACAYLEEFDEGVRLFEAINFPSPADYRWVGVCYFKLFRDVKAERSFRAAIGGGHYAARINLAHLISFQDHHDAHDELGSVSLHKLERNDVVLFHRVSSVLAEAEGDLRSAVHEAELAWKALQGLPEFNLLAPSIFNQLGVLYGRTGREQRALWFLDHALQITRGSEREKTKLRRAYVLSSLGRLQEARKELLEFQGSSPNLIVEMKRISGEVAWSASELLEAEQFFEDADQIANSEDLTANVYDRFVCNLSLSTIKAFRGNLEQATEHLVRAQRYSTDKTDRLLYRFREVLIRFWQGEYSVEHALGELLYLSEDAKMLGLMKEQGAIIVHAAAINYAMGRDISAELELLETLTMMLQNPMFVAKEWVLLPELKRKLQESGHPLVVVEPVALKVRSGSESRRRIDEMEFGT